MGLAISSISSLFAKKPKRILVLGLDAAGKTTIFWKLKSEAQHIPVIGYAVETIEFQNFQFTAFDLGGEKIRLLMHHFYESHDAVVFVFDSHDRDKERCDLAAEELHRLSSELAEDKPLLIFANKQDREDAMRIEEINEYLRTFDLKQKNWKVQLCSATKGDGILEGLDWLTDVLEKK